MALNLNDLTEGERKELLKQMKEEEREKMQKKENDRKGLKTLTEETVENVWGRVMEASEMLTDVKKYVFAEFQAAKDLKEELYDVKDTQRSHSFTTSTGKTITLGYRVTDAFDDTVQAGIDKVKKWVFSEVNGTNNENIKKIISNMLKEDKNGNLNAKRVLELSQIAMEINDEELSEAVEIIAKAFKPQKSSYFIEASYKDETGKKIGVPLSIATAPFEG